MPNTKKIVIALDTETSGMFKDGGRAIELAAICVDPDTLLPVQENPEFQIYIDPPEGTYWDDGAIEVHGIEPEFLKIHGVSEDLARGAFLAWLHSHGIDTWVSDPEWWTSVNFRERGQCIMLAQNGRFDEDYLDLLLGPTGMELFHYQKWDTMHLGILINLAHKWFLGYHGQPFKHPTEHWPSVSLVSQAHTYGISTKGAHGALADCRMTQQVFRNHVVNLAGDLRNSREYDEILAKQREKENTQPVIGSTYTAPPPPDTTKKY